MARSRRRFHLGHVCRLASVARAWLATLWTRHISRWRCYGLSPVADYVVRAEADLAQLAGVPLEDIARRPVPESVQRLFEADTSRK